MGQALHPLPLPARGAPAQREGEGHAWDAAPWQ
jgi:hypothetical protein